MNLLTSYLYPNNEKGSCTAFKAAYIWMSTISSEKASVDEQ